MTRRIILKALSVPSSPNRAAFRARLGAKLTRIGSLVIVSLLQSHHRRTSHRDLAVAGRKALIALSVVEFGSASGVPRGRDKSHNARAAVRCAGAKPPAVRRLSARVPCRHSPKEVPSTARCTSAFRKTSFAPLCLCSVYGIGLGSDFWQNRHKLFQTEARLLRPVVLSLTATPRRRLPLLAAHSKPLERV